MKGVCLIQKPAYLCILPRGLHQLLRRPVEVLREPILPQTVLAELDAELALVLAPVRPEQPAHRDVDVDLGARHAVALSVKIQIDQPVALLPVVHAVDAKHCDIHMRILHPGVLPVGELEQLARLSLSPILSLVLRSAGRL